jgi:hypothetical protein
MDPIEERKHAAIAALIEDLFQNVAYDDNINIPNGAALLMVLPWDPDWVASGEGESFGAQWERLTDWQTLLDIAEMRSAQHLRDLEEQGQAGLFQQWKATANEEDYFARLALDIRREIARLESELAMLRAQLAHRGSTRQHDDG